MNRIPKLRLRTDVGRRIVSTVDIETSQNFYETIVWGGKKKDRIAYMKRYETVEDAQNGHQEIVADVSANSSKYRLGNLF